MKRVSSGTKRKQAAKARKPALRRALGSPKAKSAPRRTAKKSSSPKKPKLAAKAKTTKPAAAKTKRVSRPQKKAATINVTAPEQVAIEVSLPVLTRTRATPKRKAVRKRVVSSKKLALAVATPPTDDLPELHLATVESASPQATRKAMPKKTARRRNTVQTAPEISPLVSPRNRSVRKSTTARRNTSARMKNSAPQSALPAFLFEGDEPGHPEISGPGEKFSLGPIAPLDHFAEAATPLPESYGTGRLFLTARDPHWLYAHWDFTREEQFRHNARSVDRHLVLRVHPATQPDQTIGEYHVHPESKHWFVHVEQAGENYSAELGYYQTGRKWKSLAASAPQRTPPGNISKDSIVKFATIPTELSFGTMLALLKETAGEAAQNAPLAHVVDKIRPRAHEHFPKRDQPGDWTPEQEQALAEVIAADRAGVALPSSEEFVAEKSWPEFTFNFDTGESAPLPLPTSYVSSFFGGAVPQDFWFNVNAELIIYGATEPNAAVTFAGKQITLRPDGSFRFRFALPDGQFELPVTAVSADGTDGRAAELKFARSTEVRGHVAEAPVDPALNPPPAF
jgi:hypothetical protein